MTQPATPNGSEKNVVLNENLGLSGPRFWCGMAQCGACAVLIRGGCAALRQAVERNRRIGASDHEIRLALGGVLYRPVTHTRILRAIRKYADAVSFDAAILSHQIVEHMATPLVLWGWHPGEGRAPIPTPLIGSWPVSTNGLPTERHAPPNHQLAKVRTSNNI